MLSRIEAPGAMSNGTRVTATGVYKDGDSHRPGDLGTISASLGPAKILGFGDELHYIYFVEWDNPSDIPVCLTDVRLREVERWRSAIIWMLYDRPHGYPNEFIARKLNHDELTNEILLFRSVEDARRGLRALGLTCIGRHPYDDPEMIEVWL